MLSLFEKNLNFTPSGLNDHFGNFNSFESYQAHVREMIIRARVDLDSPLRDTIIDANCPFQWYPPDWQKLAKKRGILLVHGLYDSPFGMQDFARHFLAKDYLVRTILLPGMGTRPADLLQIEYAEWLKAVRFGVASFQGEVDELCVAGFSTGSALAVHELLAGTLAMPVKALILLAPALQLKAQLNAVARFYKKITWSLPNPEWLSVLHELDYAKYCSCTVNSLRQVYLLSQAIKMMLPEVEMKTPSFWVVTKDDEVLSTHKLVDIFSFNCTADSQLIYYSADSPHLFDARIETRSSVFPAENVIDFSHACLPIAPNNLHYGQVGDYALAIKNTVLQATGKNLNNITLGSTKSFALFNAKGLVRLTYNPDFYHLVQIMDRFLEKIK